MKERREMCVDFIEFNEANEPNNGKERTKYGKGVCLKTKIKKGQI